MKVLTGALAIGLAVSAVPADEHPLLGIAAVCALQAGFMWMIGRCMK